MRGLHVLLLLLFLVGCVEQDAANKLSSSKSDTNLNNAPGFYNSRNIESDGGAVIMGQITAADNVTPLAGANVYMIKNDKKVKLQNAQKNNSDNESSNDSKIDEEDNGSSESEKEEDEDQCKSDNNGRFACKGIDNSGRTKFMIEKPDVAKKEFEAEVDDDKITEIKIQDTRVERKQVTSKWLVVPGRYDGVQLLLSQLKGCKLTGDHKFSAKLRKSLDCENSGLTVLNDDEIQQQFSSLDALSSFQFIFINCPTDMSAYSAVIAQYVRMGGHIYFSDWAASGLHATFPGNIAFGKKTTLGGIVASSVLNPGLKHFLGRSSVPIYFDYNAWVPVIGISSNVQTFIRGNTAPLGGKIDAPITLGWQEEGKGFVFFTSYHIEGASTGANQERSLKYLLLNISQQIRFYSKH